MPIKTSAAVILAFLGATALALPHTIGNLPKSQATAESASKKHHVVSHNYEFLTNIQPSFIPHPTLHPIFPPIRMSPFPILRKTKTRNATKTQTHNATKTKTRNATKNNTRNATKTKTSTETATFTPAAQLIQSSDSNHITSSNQLTKASNDIYFVPENSPAHNIMPFIQKITTRNPILKAKASITVTATATATHTDIITVTKTLSLTKISDPSAKGSRTATGPSAMKTKKEKALTLFRSINEHQVTKTLSKRELPTSRRSSVAPTRTVWRTSPPRKPVNKPVSESGGLDIGNSTRTASSGSGQVSTAIGRVSQTTNAKALQPTVVQVSDAALRLLRAATTVLSMAAVLALVIL